MTEPTFVALGRVVKPHGLGGELSIRLADGVVEIPVGIEVWFVPPPAGLRSGRVAAVRQGPKGPLVTVEGVDDISIADTLRGRDVVAHPEDLPDDIVDDSPSWTGLVVEDETRGVIGVVTEVIHTGANDVLVVPEGPFGQVLVPVIDDVIRDVDFVGGTCRVALLPGLIEERP